MRDDEYTGGRFVGGPWDGQACPDDEPVYQGNSLLHKDSTTAERWGHVRYEQCPLTGDYIFTGTW